MPAGTTVSSVKDIIAVIIGIFDTAEREIDFLAPPSFLSLAATYDTIERAKWFIQQGGVMRSITTITHDNVDEVRLRLEIGQQLRHSDQPHELFMFVGDQTHSISSVNIGIEEYTLNTAINAFWSESPSYAEYLLVSFEAAWSQAVPAEQRIAQLLKEG